MEATELRSWLRLLQTPEVGPITARKLLAAYGLPQAIFEQPHAALALLVGTGTASQLLSEPPDLDALEATTHDWLNTSPSGTVRMVLCLADPRFPASLLNTNDPPPLLYVHSALGFWEASGLADQLPDAVAIVGSRNASAQGLENAHAFAKALCSSGLTVVSGLALGIDGAAHQGALASGNAAATVAVVGTGLDRVYPKRHLALAHAISERGAIVSEFPIGTQPMASNFPRRNRIIASLSRGTLVVEAALQSGSLITARLAAEQGKDVFAIPGSIHSTHVRGCHALIKQGAKLVESADDVLGELGWLGARPTQAKSSPLDEAPMNNGPHFALLEAMGHDPLGLDALCARTGSDAGTLQAALLELELSGRVARMPGGLFQRLFLA